MSDTILLVDDEPGMRALARALLRDYSVLEASDAQEALALSAQHAGRIDVLLSDVSMPGMNGIELARQLGPRRPEMRVLLMSSFPEPPDTGCPFLEKRVLCSQLRDRLHALLAG